ATMFSLRPELRSSTPTTLWPSASKRSTSVDPMKPAAPVTSVRIGSPYRGPNVHARTVGSLSDELGRPRRRRADRRAIGRSGGAGVSWLFLLGRPDPDRPGGHAKPAVAGVSVRRSRRSRDAGGVPGGGWHHQAGSIELDRAGDQPGGDAVVGVTGAVAGAARHSRLAAG